MRNLLLYITDINKIEEIGVYKKIISQCNEFKKLYETILIYRQNNSLCIENITWKNVEIISNFFCVEDETIYKLNKINKFININRLNSYIYNFINNNKPNIIYIRKYKFFSKGLKYIKYAKKILGCYVICEIPTYPYKKEFLNKKKYLGYIIDKYFDYRIHKLVDKIAVVLGEDIELNSNKLMAIQNGIDISNIKTKEKVILFDSINLIGVAHIANWHGYDRVIEGLKNYYSIKDEKKTLVYFHIVGDGLELANLKNLVNEYKLNDYVIFYGSKIGQDLDELFNKSDVGVGSLANHRKGMTKDSALKSREYCARGIPFIIASNDDGFNPNFKYILRIKQDESPVNINQVLKFYDSIKKDNYIEEMRNYVEKNLTWEAVMKPVIYLINNEISKMK